MPRRGRISKRDVLPDPLYNSKLVTKLINNVMYDGKKGVSQKIVYDAFAIVEAKLGQNPLEVFQAALDNIMPELEVKARRVGGSTYQVPMEVRADRRQTLGRLREKTRRTHNGRPSCSRNNGCKGRNRRSIQEKRRSTQNGRIQQSIRTLQILIVSQLLCKLLIFFTMSERDALLIFNINKIKELNQTALKETKYA